MIGRFKRGIDCNRLLQTRRRLFPFPCIEEHPPQMIMADGRLGGPYQTGSNSPFRIWLPLQTQKQQTLSEIGITGSWIEIDRAIQQFHRTLSLPRTR